MEVKKTLPPGGEQLLAEAERVDGDELDPSNLHQAGATSAGEGGAAQDPAGAEPAPIAATIEQEITAFADMMGAALAQFFPSTKEIITEQKAGELGAALAPVVRKYPWLERLFLGAGGWRVEFRAAVVVGPVVLAMREAIGRDLAELRQGPPAAPGAELGAGGGAPPASPSSRPRKPPPPGTVVQVS